MKQLSQRYNKLPKWFRWGVSTFIAFPLGIVWGIVMLPLLFLLWLFAEAYKSYEEFK